MRPHKTTPHQRDAKGGVERQQAKRRMDAPVRLRFASHLFPGSLRQIERMVNDMNLKEDSKRNETAEGGHSTAGFRNVRLCGPSATVPICRPQDLGRSG